MKRPRWSAYGLALTLLIPSYTFVASTEAAELAPLPAPTGVPSPGPTNDAPYVPQPILPGGIVVPLYPADSSFLKPDRIREAEYYSLSKSAPGRINSITNIHNPS